MPGRDREAAYSPRKVQSLETDIGTKVSRFSVDFGDGFVGFLLRVGDVFAETDHRLYAPATGNQVALSMASAGIEYLAIPVVNFFEFRHCR